MLKQLRQKRTMKRILWALAILIIPPFVFWGGGSALRSMQNGPAYAGIMFGKKVSFEEYAKAWEETKNQALLMYGSKMDDMKDSIDLGQQTWERLILLAEANKKRVRVSDAEVIGTIQNFGFLQSRGKFDRKAYELVLRQAFRTEPRQFEEGMRNSLKIFKLRDSVLKDMSISDEELKNAYKRENEKSRIAYILISPSEFKDGLNIPPEDIKKYYDANTEEFRIADQVNAEYIGFEFSNESEKEKALAEAEKIDYILADKAKSFGDAARENSLAINETGFFAQGGPIPKIGWFPEIQKAAFSLKAGERSTLLKSKVGLAKGFYIIRVKEKKPSYIPGLEEAKVKIEALLKEEKARGLALEAAEKLHKEISGAMKANNEKFENAASGLNHPPKMSEPFVRDSYIPGIGMATELGEEAFAAKTGELAPLARTRGGLCIYAVSEITPADWQKLDKEKEEFRKKALEAKKTEVLNSWYFDLLKRADLKSNVPAE